MVNRSLARSLSLAIAALSAVLSAGACGGSGSTSTSEDGGGPGSTDAAAEDAFVIADSSVGPDARPDAGGGHDAASDGGPTTVDVTVGALGALAFAPSTVTIHVGDTVRWTFAGNNHDVVSGTNGKADDKFCSPNDMSCATSPTSSSGTVYAHRFTLAGTYPYFCRPFANAGMTGVVTVE